MTMEFMAGLVVGIDKDLLVKSLAEELEKYKTHKNMDRLMPSLMMLTIKIHMEKAGVSTFMEHLEEKKEFDLFKTFKNPS